MSGNKRKKKAATKDNAALGLSIEEQNENERYQPVMIDSRHSNISVITTKADRLMTVTTQAALTK